MKKTCLVLILIVSVVVNVKSRDISQAEAEKVAKNFHNERFLQNKIDGSNPFSSVLKITKYTKKVSCFVFNIESQQGYIIVSSSDNLPPILGYSFQGCYVEEHQNNAFNFWMENIAKYSISIEKANKYKIEWEEYLTEDFKKTNNVKGVDPLLTIAWGQSCYYNANCPVDSGGSCYHARTGCGATAMAMIMKYWDFPAHGYGNNAYENPPYGFLFADFENTYYDWTNMPPTLNSQSTSTEINAVAELMYHCGIAVNMVYGTNSSSSDNWNHRNAFTNHFDYSSESQFVDKEDYPDSIWVSILQSEMDNGRPVFYGISSGSGGHFVVLDGYQDDEYFHYNWGYGYLNGYYKTFDELPIIQQAIIGIEPNSEKLTGIKELYAYNGVFNDGSNHEQYPNNKTYHWLICPDSAESIVLLFTEFATEYQYDFVNIYDGETTTSPLLGSFSGHKLPPHIQSSGNKVLVEFISNDLLSDHGWNLRYTTLRSDLACSGVSVLTESTGTFDDGSSTSNYIDNADCFWLIKPDTASSINLHFENFNTETNWDFLYVYNGENPSKENLLATFTGNISPPDISSTEGAMLLHFHADWNTNRPGWEVSYTTNYERINLDIKVFLQGSFLNSGMSADINPILPNSQPYASSSSAPWYYEGDETVNPIPGPDIVDWIIVELRNSPIADSAKSNTIIAKKPAFLISNGTVVSLDGNSTLQFNNSITQQLFVVIWHRNHLGVMSAIPVVESEGVYSYDFTTSSEQAYNNGQQEIESGVWGIIGGDGSSHGIVNELDKTIWSNQVGTNGYIQVDFNMDGQVTNLDKNDIWILNVGAESKVPE